MRVSGEMLSPEETEFNRKKSKKGRMHLYESIKNDYSSDIKKR